uniref:Uncharacterized protein n=1 Tax=Meloidogyne hapla TaxID=6305 RepID=A0A1I8AY24_MELHA
MEDNPNTEIIQNNATDSTYTKGSFTTSIPLKITSKPKKKKTNSRKILKKTPSKVNQKSFSTSKPIISTNPPTAGKKNKKQDTQFDVKFNNQMLEFLKILFNSSPNKKF